MPYKPMKPCSRDGCPNLTHDRYCAQHAGDADFSRRAYNYDPAVRKRYGSRWRAVRAAYIAAHPLCEQCRREGRFTPAEEVHHILPLSQGGGHDTENLMSLCKRCHSGITLAENNRMRG